MSFIQLIVVFNLMMYPYFELSNAGWRATLNNYYYPISFGMFFLCVFLEVCSNKDVCNLRKLFASFALVYACNQELELVFLTVVVCVIGTYYLIKRKGSLKHVVYLGIQFSLLVLSYIYIIFCPGIKNRNVAESERILNFNYYSMTDKLDAGISTTLYVYIFGSYVFLIVLCFVLSYIMMCRYKTTRYKTLAICPLVILLLCGPLNNIAELLFPAINRLKDPLEVEGLISEGNSQWPPIAQIILFSLFLICLIMNFLSTAKNNNAAVIIVSMIAGGIASRVAMGFSPTIYASGNRTFSVLGFSLMAAGLCAMSNNVELFEASEIKQKWQISTGIIASISVINLFTQIY